MKHAWSVNDDKYPPPPPPTHPTIAVYNCSGESIWSATAVVAPSVHGARDEKRVVVFPESRSPQLTVVVGRRFRCVFIKVWPSSNQRLAATPTTAPAIVP